MNERALIYRKGVPPSFRVPSRFLGFCRGSGLQGFRIVGVPGIGCRIQQ